MKYYFLRNIKYRPSTYYRVYQYLDDIKKYNICEYENNKYYTSNLNSIIKKIIFGFVPGYINRLITIMKILFKKKSTKVEIFIQREIFPQRMLCWDKILLKKLIKKVDKIYWDFDDDILNSKEITKFEFEILSEKSDFIFVGNQNLKEKIDFKFWNKVQIVNTTDKEYEKYEFNKVLKKREDSFINRVNLIWLGTSGNLYNLNLIINDLDKIAAKINKEIELYVISDKEYRSKVKNLKINNIKWKRDNVSQVLNEMHIGIMPLENTEFNKGKCAFKAIQYMGAGLPILVSPVGLNKEIIDENGFFLDNEDRWMDEMINLSYDLEKWKKYSKNSRKKWEEKFNSKKIGRFYRGEKNVFK